MPRTLRYAGLENGPLDANARHRFALLFALEIYEPRAICSLIPKNACSTLRYALARANGVLTGLDQIGWIHENTHSFAADLPALARARYSFVVLRCPFRRLASAFLDKIVSMAPPFERFYGPDADPGAVTFRDFATRVCSAKGVRADIHWRPQADFLVYSVYDDWFRLEDFAAAATTLRDRIGLKVEDTRDALGHDTGRLARDVDACHSDTSVSELRHMRDHGIVPDPKTLFDDDIARRVGLTYAGDLALYASRFGTEGLLFPRLSDTVIAQKEVHQ